MMDEQKRESTKAAGARIKYLRRAKDISQEDLALQAGIYPAYFGQVERGLKRPTIFNTATMLCSDCGTRIWQEDNAGTSMC